VANAQQAQAAGLRVDLARETALLFPGIDVRLDGLVHEAAHGVAHHAVGFVEIVDVNPCEGRVTHLQTSPFCVVRNTPWGVGITENVTPVPS
jgi:hypothetical protein